MEEKQKKSVMTLDEVSRIAQDSYLKILNENRIKVHFSDNSGEHILTRV